MIKKIVTTSMLACLLAYSTGCMSLSRSERTMLQELESYGVESTEQQKKGPVTAGVLNILPGFGNFYLGIGTDESAQWLYGFLNLLTWPISVVWGIPEAAIDAKTINKKETIYYYKFNPKGKKEFQKLKAERQ